MLPFLPLQALVLAAALVGLLVYVVPRLVGAPVGALHRACLWLGVAGMSLVVLRVAWSLLHLAPCPACGGQEAHGIQASDRSLPPGPAAP